MSVYDFSLDEVYMGSSFRMSDDRDCVVMETIDGYGKPVHVQVPNGPDWTTLADAIRKSVQTGEPGWWRFEDSTLRVYPATAGLVDQIDPRSPTDFEFRWEVKEQLVVLNVWQINEFGGLQVLLQVPNGPEWASLTMASCYAAVFGYTIDWEHYTAHYAIPPGAAIRLARALTTGRGDAGAHIYILELLLDIAPFGPDWARTAFINGMDSEIASALAMAFPA